MDYKEPFKKDKKGLYYLDSNSIKTEELDIGKPDELNSRRATFLSIDGIDDYIIKDCTKYPLVFNQYRNLSLLKRLVEKQALINNVDFPIGYYKNVNIIQGTIIPYYKDSISINDLIKLHSFDELQNYYDHDSNKVDNLIYLLLEILELISNMYDHGVYYLDIHSGNFLVYKNSVKVIDFEPGHVSFNEKKWNLNIMLNNYALLVGKISRLYNFSDIFFRSGENFHHAEINVKALRKKLER